MPEWSLQKETSETIYINLQYYFKFNHIKYELQTLTPNLNRRLQLETSTGDFNWRLQLETSTGDFNWRLQYELWCIRFGCKYPCRSFHRRLHPLWIMQLSLRKVVARQHLGYRQLEPQSDISNLHIRIFMRSCFFLRFSCQFCSSSLSAHIFWFTACITGPQKLT